MRVKIKTWDEMLIGRNLDIDGDIDHPSSCFTIGMEDSMPNDRIIEVDNKDHWKKDSHTWTIEEWMISSEVIEDDTLERIIGDI
jgi:hypothetical protein